MNTEYNMIGCFSCKYFFKKEDSVARPEFWCDIYDEEVEILSRKSCHCYGFERSPEFCCKNLCRDCRDTDICKARNKFMPFRCNVDNCHSFLTCKMRLEEIASEV